MDFGLDKFLGWQTLLFGLAVYFAVLAFRRVVELAFRKYVYSAGWWATLLSFLPGLVGLAGGVWMPWFPFPEGIETPGTRGVFGLVVGMASGVIYRAAKKLIESRFPGIFDSKPSNTPTLPPGKP